jgi:hypothetical protein
MRLRLGTIQHAAHCVKTLKFKLTCQLEAGKLFRQSKSFLVKLRSLSMNAHIQVIKKTSVQQIRKLSSSQQMGLD